MMKKKVILYNTHLAGLISNGKEQLEKIRDTLLTFSRREDVVLLWRPHPLSSETLAAMNPHVRSQYSKLVEEYKRMDFGIYDESPDLYRAIGAADAYYGDASSLVSLFLLTGKPVMLQSARIHSQDKANAKHRVEDVLPFMENFVEANKKIIFISSAYNAIFKLDPDSGRVDYLDCCEGRPIISEYLFYGAVLEGSQIVFTPRNADCILCYDLIKHGRNIIPIPDTGIYQNRYYETVKCGKYIYLFPLDETDILRYQLDTQEVETDTSWRTFIGESLDLGSKPVFHHGAAVKGSSFFIAYFHNNAVLERSEESGQWIIHRVGEKNLGYASIVYDGDIFWLLGNDWGSVYLWDGMSQQIERVELSIDGFSGGRYPFCNILYSGGYIYLIANTANMVLRMHSKTREAECIRNLNLVDTYYSVPEGYGKYSCAKVLKNGNILAYSLYEKCLQEIDCRTGAVHSIPLKYGPKDMEMLERLLLQEVNNISLIEGREFHCGYDRYEWINMENQYLNLDKYLDLIVNSDGINEEQREYFKKQYSEGEGTSGKKIYMEIMKLVSN